MRHLVAVMLLLGVGQSAHAQVALDVINFGECTYQLDGREYHVSANGIHSRVALPGEDASIVVPHKVVELFDCRGNKLGFPRVVMPADAYTGERLWWPGYGEQVYARSASGYYMLGHVQIINQFGSPQNVLVWFAFNKTFTPPQVETKEEVTNPAPAPAPAPPVEELPELPIPQLETEGAGDEGPALAPLKHPSA